MRADLNGWIAEQEASLKPVKAQNGTVPSVAVAEGRGEIQYDH